MIIFGWGKVTKKFLGAIGRLQCGNCNNEAQWELCVLRVWFTLFFIPVIPYKTTYCMMCPVCNSYIEVSKERFEELKGALSGGIDDAIKYAGKTPTQISYLKAVEEQRRREVSEKE